MFHDQATADQAVFETIGGTVAKGDGGNSQFYGQSTAANGVFYNYGGTCASANGGDVAFDAEANGGNAMFHNYAAPAEGAYGGVTSFNNNPPAMAVNQGTSAAHGSYLNYGARAGQLGGGGHLSLSAKYGSPTAANATIHNYGSTLAAKSSAGHTIFSISLPTPYWPTAGQATIYNHPAVSAGAAAGYTAFSVYNETSTPADASTQFPTADKSTILNLGGRGDKVTGGYTVFSGQTSAGQATLIAYGGINGGYGGKISFYDQSVGGTAKIILTGNGELDLADHSGELTLSSLELTGGIISVQLGSQTTSLNLSESLSLTSSTSFYFWTNSQGGFAANTHYTLLTAPNLSQVTVDQFEGNDVNGLSPTFSIVGNELQVCFN